MSLPGRWQRFCVVGVGGHARTKLIPAIEANGQAVAGLVSRQAASDLPAYPVFTSIDAALGALPPDVVFVLASPPAAHADQALAVAAAGRDLVIEKPAFLTAAAAARVLDTAEAASAVVVEGFMHRHGRLHAALTRRFARDDIRAIDIDFRIPALPEGTFRQERPADWTSLYDIGCYAVSLLTELALPLGGLALTAADGAGRVTLAGTLGRTDVTADIGIGPAYVNAVTLRDGTGRDTAYAPYFYGRPGPRTIDGPDGTTIVDDGDAFRAMFATPRDRWRADQPQRWSWLLDATRCLDRLARGLPNRDGRG